MTDAPVAKAVFHDPASWMAEQLRVTTFLAPGEADPDSSIWDTVVSEPPEQRLEQPKLGTRVQAGPFGHGQLVMQIQPGRVDWHHIPGPTVIDASVSPVGPTIPNVGTWADAAEQFLPVARKWLSESPKVRRIAFGAVLLLPAASPAEAFANLRALLPTVALPTSSPVSDLLFKINRPTQFKMTDQVIRLNRLTEWQLLGVKLVLLAPGSGVSQSGIEQHGCQLTLDINTDGERQDVIPKDHCVSILDELSRIAMEIAATGDRA